MKEGVALAPEALAEVAPQILLLKHMRDWSHENVTREVRANLVYREFTGLGGRWDGRR